MTNLTPLVHGLFATDKVSGEIVGLRASRCHTCSDVSFPYSIRCPNCASTVEPGEILLSRSGTVFEFTTVYSPAPGFVPPYTVGYVDLDEGIRVYSQFEAAEGKPLHEGDVVHFALKEIPFLSETRLGYVFKT